MHRITKLGSTLLLVSGCAASSGGDGALTNEDALGRRLGSPGAEDDSAGKAVAPTPSETAPAASAAIGYEGTVSVSGVSYSIAIDIDWVDAPSTYDVQAFQERYGTLDGFDSSKPESAYPVRCYSGLSGAAADVRFVVRDAQGEALNDTKGRIYSSQANADVLPCPTNTYRFAKDTQPPSVLELYTRPDGVLVKTSDATLQIPATFGYGDTTSIYLPFSARFEADGEPNYEESLGKYRRSARLTWTGRLVPTFPKKLAIKIDPAPRLDGMIAQDTNVHARLIDVTLALRTP